MRTSPRPRLFLRLLAAGLLLGLGACQDSGLDLSSNAAKKIVVGEPVPVAVESLEGPPADLAPRFSAALATEAQSRGIVFTDADKAPRFRLRGYLSAAPGEGGTSVAYVFDLFDQGKRRAQRISGSEIVKKSAPEAWQVVDEAVLRRIAARGMNEVAGFLSERPAEGPPVAARQGPQSAARAELPAE